MKRLLEPVLKPLLSWYLSRKRYFRYKGMQIAINPGVFHPGFFFSSRILLDYLDKQDLKEQKILDLGAGSGILALWAVRKGAMVTAIDIDKRAVDNIKANTKEEGIRLEAYQSDLFQNVPAGRYFDWIVINPPYYPYYPAKKRDWAFYCGENLEFFEQLFEQLGKYVHNDSVILMILSEDCYIGKIRFIAHQKGWAMEMVEQRRAWGEENYIFSVKNYSEK